MLAARVHLQFLSHPRQARGWDGLGMKPEGRLCPPVVPLVCFLGIKGDHTWTWVLSGHWISQPPTLCGMLWLGRKVSGQVKLKTLLWKHLVTKFRAKQKISWDKFGLSGDFAFLIAIV